MKSNFKLGFILSSLIIYSTPVFSKEKTAALKDPWCPMVVASGSSLGPIKLGASKKSLLKKGLPLMNSVVEGEKETAEAGPFKIQFKKSAVEEVWVSDLFEHLNCVTYKGKVLKERLVGNALLDFFGGGRADPDNRYGGRFYICSKGGVWLGTAPGTSTLQLRIRKK